MKIILVLGSPNFENGTLSDMAKSRVEMCFDLYKNGQFKIALTGGYGAHFNTTGKPHAEYLKQALLTKGVFEADIIAQFASANSVEDATLSRYIVGQFEPEEIVVVTSDYHAERARLIFKTVFAPFSKINIVAASSGHISQAIIRPLIEHETKALQDLLDNGVRY